MSVTVEFKCRHSSLDNAAINYESFLFYQPCFYMNSLVFLKLCKWLDIRCVKESAHFSTCHMTDTKTNTFALQQYFSLTPDSIPTPLALIVGVSGVTEVLLGYLLVQGR